VASPYHPSGDCQAINKENFEERTVQLEPRPGKLVEPLSSFCVGRNSLGSFYVQNGRPIRLEIVAPCSPKNNQALPVRRARATGRAVMGPFEFSPWGGPTATWILVQAPLGNIIRKDETLRGLSTSCPPLSGFAGHRLSSSPLRPSCPPGAAGRICLGNRKIKLNQVFASQAVGIKDVHNDIWLMSIMDYDLGYFDLETRVLEPLQNPFGQKVLPM